MTTTLAAAPTNSTTMSPHSLAGDLGLRVRPPEDTAATGEVSIEGAASSFRGSDFEVDSPVPIPAVAAGAGIETRPVQVWEGVVLEVNSEASLMNVRLVDKLGHLPAHTATIGFDWIHEQDLELMKPGAVFYLTVFKRRTRGSVQNAQEIRFQRLPNWSNSNIHTVHVAADELASRMTVPNAPD